jgi:23S rRNA (guanosine2251-2'-O)-methyltransferase
MIINSINALIEALKGDAPIAKVLLEKGQNHAKIDAIARLCKERGVICQWVPSDAMRRKAGAGHQGVFAEVAPVAFHPLADILAAQAEPFLLIVDGVTDTGNLGAIVRTAVAAGVDAIVLSSRHSAPVNDTVYKTSAGALAHAKLVLSKNLAQDLELLKARKFWIAASDSHATQSYLGFDFLGPMALVIGSEERGVSPLLKKRADQLITIPHAAAVESLNVAAAAAILLFEARRQRLA